MKDYNLIRYIIKRFGQDKQRDKHLLYLDIPFGKNCYYTAYIYFAKKESIRVDFDLKEVHNAYGSKFGSLSDFTRMLADSYTFLEFDPEEQEVYCLLYEHPIEHKASQALAQITFMTHILNKALGTDYDIIFEEDWRNLHREYLTKKEKNSQFGFICSIFGFILSIGLTFLTNNDPTLVLIPVLLTGPLSVICAIVFFIKKRFYKKELTRSRTNTK